MTRAPHLPSRHHYRPSLADVLLYAIPAAAVVLAGEGKLMGWA